MASNGGNLAGSTSRLDGKASNLSSSVSGSASTGTLPILPPSLVKGRSERICLDVTPCPPSSAQAIVHVIEDERNEPKHGE